MRTEERTNIYLMKTDYYVRDKKKMIEWEGLTKNKDIIIQHQNFLFAKGTGTYRVSKVSWQLRTIANMTLKPLTELNYKDVEDILSKLNQNSKYAQATKADYRRIIKSFYKWFKEQDSRLDSEDKSVRDEAVKLYKYVENNIKKSYNTTKIDYSNIITDEDVRNLINATPLIMEKAIISMLHETGCRIAELLNIRLKDVEIKKDYAMVKVDGKTGERRIPIIQSLPYLLRYIDQHLDKDNLQSLLWISNNHRFYKRPLHYIGIKRILQKNFTKIGLEKKCNPHWFRHSRATLLLEKGYNEEIIRMMLGWTPGSDMIKIYVHGSMKQVEKAFREVNGLIKPEEREKKVQYCVCGNINEDSAKYCYKCGKALNIITFVEDQDKLKTETDKSIQLLMEIMKNPELLKRFEEYKKSLR